MKFIGLGSDITDSALYKDVVLQRVEPNVNPSLLYQAELAIPILYSEQDEGMRDHAVEWMVSLTEQVANKISTQAQEITPQPDLGGYPDYLNETLRGIRIIGEQVLRGQEPFGRLLNYDKNIAPEPGSDFIMMRVIFAIQKHPNPNNETPERKPFLVCFVAAEQWSKDIKNPLKVKLVHPLMGSWDL